jgi:MoxR-like ATPase
MMDENSLNEAPLTSDEASAAGQINSEVLAVMDFASHTKAEIQKVIIGMDDTIDMLINGLLSNGHVLLEGIPGVAKTLLVKLIANVLDVEFKRIQFTPDLMPTDVIGTNIYNMQSATFNFRRGPVFSNIILADEINRAPAKTQSSLFEVMEERQVTVDGETYKMNYPLFVVATQNPIEQEGTYKLPEAQLDRFLFRLKIGYPSVEEENRMLARFKSDFFNTLELTVNKLYKAEDLKRFTNIIEKVYIKDELLNYIASIMHQTRNNSSIFLGASPRASLAVMRSSKVAAAMSGRDFVTPDDIRKVAEPVLNHRLILTPEREIEGITTVDVINDIVKNIEVPR